MARENHLVLALVCVYLELGLLVNAAVLYPSVQWSFQNPGFKDGTFRLNVLPMSKVNIICPHMATSLVKTHDTSSNLRYENFWIVDNSSYHSCNVNTNITENRILFKCDKPRQIYFEQLVFQSHGMDNSLVFTKGRTYYFISTSTGLQDSLGNTKGGHCRTANMKMEIYICKGSQDVHCSDVKPTTQPFAVESIRIKQTTASTAGIKTTQLTSTKQPPEPTHMNSTQTPQGPDVDYLKKEKEESPLTNGTVWIVIVVMLGAMLAVSVGINFHFGRKQKKQNGSKKPSYDRGCSLSPPLMAPV